MHILLYCALLLCSFLSITNSAPLHVMIMCYKRVNATEGLMQQLLSLLDQQPDGPTKWNSVHLTVTQSCESSSDEHVSQLRAILERPNSAFTSVIHVCTPKIQADTSYSTAPQHGSKRNSMNNLLHGLDIAFTGQHQPVIFKHGTTMQVDTTTSVQQTDGPSEAAKDDNAMLNEAAKDNNAMSNEAQQLQRMAQARVDQPLATAAYPIIYSVGMQMRQVSPLQPAPAVLVLEDDVVLSQDALSFFRYAAGFMSNGNGPDSGTTTETASSMDIPADINGADGRATIASAEITVETSINGGREAVALATALSLQRTNILFGNKDAQWQESVRMWLSGIYGVPSERIVQMQYLLPRAVFKTLAWMISAPGFKQLEQPYRQALEYESPRELAGDNVRARSSVLSGCVVCNDYCYDHVIETTFAGQPFLAPVIPRVTQISGSGMTSVVNDINEFYEGVPVSVDSFVIQSVSSWFLSFFRNPGIDDRSTPYFLPAITFPMEIAWAYITEPTCVILECCMLSCIAMFLLRRKRGKRGPIIPLRMHDAAAHKASSNLFGNNQSQIKKKD